MPTVEPTARPSAGPETIERFPTPLDLDLESRLVPGLLVTRHVRLVRQLGRGGMGTVWLAEHLTLKSRVVVKFMSPHIADNPESRARFSLEAAAAAQVKSPHVVQIFDYGVSDQGLPYIVMELLEGMDLGKLLDRRERLPLAEVAVIVAQVSLALERAHERGIVHRDIKPENIFLCDQGDGEIFAKVLDFGIAKDHSAKLTNLTQTGIMVGTPFYMAPEQLLEGRPADASTDLWALAVVAYEAMTGIRPFEGETVALVAIAMTRERRAPSSWLPTIPRSVDRFFEKALATERGTRFTNAIELADALLAATDTRLTVPPVSSSMSPAIAALAPRLPVIEGVDAAATPALATPALETPPLDGPGFDKTTDTLALRAAPVSPSELPTRMMTKHRDLAWIPWAQNRWLLAVLAVAALLVLLVLRST